MFVTGERAQVEQLGPHAVNTGAQGAFLPRFLFIPIVLKKGKQCPGSFWKDIFPAATSLAQLRAVSAQLRPVLAHPRGTSREIWHIAVLSRQPKGQETSCPKGCPAPASWLQAQTTKKAQESDALKTSRHEAAWSRAGSEPGLGGAVFCAQMWQAIL